MGRDCRFRTAGTGPSPSILIPAGRIASLYACIRRERPNHNAGMLQFGPDGYLYIAAGDGDSGVLNPPGAFAQPLDDLLGNILRIDPRETADGEPYSVPDTNPFVGVAGDRPEIWAYGFRNPWRFWVDSKTGDTRFERWKAEPQTPARPPLEGGPTNR